MRAERIVIERCEHRLQAGEVGAPSRDDQHCMQELAVQPLHFEEVMRAFLPPLGDDCKVPCLFLVRQVHNPRSQVPLEAQVRDFLAKWN